MCDVYVVVACTLHHVAADDERKNFHETFHNIKSLACKCDTSKDEFIVTESSHSFLSSVASFYRFYRTKI